MTADSVVMSPAARQAVNRERQHDLYGTTLRTLVYRLAADYGITQARIADTIGVSHAMLSLLVSARRISLGPVAHTRLMLLDQRRNLARALAEPSEVDAILADIAHIQRPWPHHRPDHDGSDARASTDVLLAADPEELAAAAGKLETDLPHLAGLLRHAADHRTRRREPHEPKPAHLPPEATGNRAVTIPMGASTTQSVREHSPFGI